MSLGEILDRTFQVYRPNFLVLAGIAVLPLTVQMAMYLICFPLEGLVRQMTISTTLQRQIIESYGWVATGFSSYFLNYMMWPIFCIVAGQILFGKCNLKAALVEGRSRWRGLLALAALFWILENRVPVWLHGRISRSWVAMPLWLSLIMSTIEGFALMAPLLLSVPAWTIERTNVTQSIARSWTLSKGAYGRMFIAILLNAVCYGSIASMIRVVIFLVFNLVARDGSISLMNSAWTYLPGYIASITTAPLIPIAITLFYFDQRIRKEGFDIEWMMQQAGMTVQRSPAEPAAVPEIAVGPSTLEAAVDRNVETIDLNAAAESSLKGTPEESNV